MAAANDVVKIEISGTRLTLRVNGNSVCTATDIASGQAGIIVEGSTASTRYLDDWEGDDIGGSAAARSRPSMAGK
jgi:hypothetical protein